tara:strand:- start:2017 stop:2937 length:921 start_codon:yes stop_codon:yes gene_type:complete
MGFFSALGGAVGSLFGPTGAVIGASLGGALDGKKASDKQKKAIAEQNRIAQIASQNTNAQFENNSRPVETKNSFDFDGTIKSARNAGLNPLTALRLVGSNSVSTTTQVGLTRYVAPLLSSMPSRNFTDVMSDAFYGYQSFQLGKINREKEGLEMQYLRNQVANSDPLKIINTPTINSAEIRQNQNILTFGDYPLKTTEVEINAVKTDIGYVDNTQESVLKLKIDRHGNKHVRWFDEYEWDEILFGGLDALQMEAQHYGTKAIKYRDKKIDEFNDYIKKSYIHPYKYAPTANDPRVNWVKEIGSLFD